MTFQPVLPLSGYAGWRFLERTLPQQQEAFNESTTIARATDHFRANIANIRTAEDLVADRRLLEVALGAFGLQDDINNKAFIQRILEDGTVDEDALANRLADNRYAALAREFGFGNPSGARTNLSFFADRIIDRYETKSFQRAVGDQNNDLRLAMNFNSELGDILQNTESESAQWFRILGNPPMRTVFQTALGLPTQVAGLDLDRQLEVFRDRARSVFGSDKVSDFADPAMEEKAVRLFLIRSEAAAVQATSTASVALSLIQAIPRGSLLGSAF